MVVDWKDKSVQDRLLTAVIASVDNKISPAEIARLYGPDMTYYAVENYLRKFRRDAKEMKKEAGDRDVPAPSPARKKASPVKGGVKGGRVKKNTQAGRAKIKPEVLEAEVYGSDEDDGPIELEEDVEEV